MLGMGLGRMGRNGGVRPGAVVRALFANGEQGAWYDPSDFSTMFQDSAGTTPVTATGQPVGRILDKSGRGNHATQPTAAARPVYQIDGSGRPHLLFDGVDDFMLTGSVNFTATDKISFWMGLYVAATSSRILELSLDAGSAANPGAFVFRHPTSTVYDIYLRGSALGALETGAAYAVPVTNVVSANLDLAQATNATEITPRINAAIPASLATPGGAAASAGTGNFGNYPLYLSALNGAGGRFNGRLYQTIVRGARSTTQQISDVETFVNAKTGAY